MYVTTRLGVGVGSNLTESIDVTGNMKASSNIYARNRIGVGNSNPRESLEITGNILSSSNLYVTTRLGVGVGSNPREALETTGNILTSGNIYCLTNLSIGHSNPSEICDVIGNSKVSGNLYSMGNVGIGTSNPSLSLEVNGHALVNSNLEIKGSLTVRGATTVVESTTINITDNIIRLNNGAVYSSTLQAGFEINRGIGYNNYYIVFDENSGTFKIGEPTSLQAVATRDDTIANNAIAVYDGINYKYKGSNTFIYSNNSLGIRSSNPTEALDVTGNIKVSSNIYALTRQSIGGSNPRESLDVTGNIKASSNIYALTRQSIGSSNPTESLDVIGNIKASANVYALSGIGVGNSNPREKIEVTGNIWSTSNIYATVKLGVGVGSNPTEALDVTGNIKASSNIYAMTRQSIGGSNPREALDVTGNIKASSNIYALTRQSIGSSNPTESLDVIGNIKASSNLYILNRLSIGSSNPSEVITLTGNLKASSNIYSLHRLSIGHSNPNESIDIFGNIKASSNIYALAKLGIATSNPAVGLEVNTTDALLISKGTTAQRPSAPLEGYMRYNTDIQTFEGYGAGNSWGSLGGVIDTNQDTYISPESIPTSNDDNLVFYNSNVESMRITRPGWIGISNNNPSERLELSGGNMKLNSNLYVLQRLSIGKSNPSSPLDVIGDANLDGALMATKYVLSRGIQVKKRNSSYLTPSTVPSGNVIGVSNDTQGLVLSISGTTSNNYFKFVAAASELMRVTGNGNVGIGLSNPSYKLHIGGDIYATGDILAFSDKRYKDNILNISDVLNKVSQLSAYSYTRKDYEFLNEPIDTRHIGVLAQDVKEIFPDSVKYDCTNDRYGVDYNSLTALLIETIKEMRQEYTQRINMLEKTIESLLSGVCL